MSISFHKDWRNRGGDETPPSVRILKVKDPKKSGGIPCRLLVSREDTRTDFSAKITLRYVSLDDPNRGFNNHPFSGEWERLPCGAGKVSLTCGSLVLSGTNIPRGAHIGTYLFDEIVRWAKQWPDAQIQTISLSSNDGTKDNLERRNRFYEQFGIRFRYNNDLSSGVSESMSVFELKPVAPSVWGCDLAGC